MGCAGGGAAMLMGTTTLPTVGTENATAGESTVTATIAPSSDGFSFIASSELESGVTVCGAETRGSMTVGTASSVAGFILMTGVGGFNPITPITRYAKQIEFTHANARFDSAGSSSRQKRARSFSNSLLESGSLSTFAVELMVVSRLTFESVLRSIGSEKT